VILGVGAGGGPGALGGRAEQLVELADELAGLLDGLVERGPAGDLAHRVEPPGFLQATVQGISLGLEVAKQRAGASERGQARVVGGERPKRGSPGKAQARIKVGDRRARGRVRRVQAW
jgi:hypothetical protein